MISNAEIKRIIDSEFKFTPVQRTANILHSHGVRSQTLYEMKTGSYMPDPIRVAIYNELKDIERRRAVKA